MAWRLEVEGRVVQKGGKTFRIGPGLDEETVITLDVPKVRRRTPARFILSCSRGGREVFREVKGVWIIDADGARSPVAAAGELAVLDPQGSVKARLTRRGVRFTDVASFEAIPGDAKVIVVGKDALTPRQATDPKWRRLAGSGARVLVLDQKTPLHFQAVPADFELTDHVGRIAFSENPEHPVFDGLDQPDFFTWSKDHVVYRNVYRKASKGARSLVQCDRELSCSAIAECPVSEGLLLLCQMVVGEKLGTDPVAQRLFDNMLNYCFDYEVVRKATASTVKPAAPEGRMIASLGLKYDRAADVLSAIEGGRHEIVLAGADPGNLRKLAAGLGRLKAFTAKGGWLVLWGLGPEGLADFNRVVGVEHLIRPFEMERVTMPAVHDPILSGLTVRDVVMESGQKIQRHAGDKFLADDVFTYVVDIDGILAALED